MGCSGSKQNQQENAKDPTLLQQKAPEAQEAEKKVAAAEPPKNEEEPNEEPAPNVVQEVCKSCGGNGKDILGRRCKCPIGEALVGPSVPVEVIIVSARGLRNADWIGKSDPYVSCEVSGKPTPRKPDPLYTTKVVNNNLNPEWNQEIRIGHYCVGNSLTFTVKDNDPLKNDDPLGQVTVTSAQFFENGFEGELQLSGEGHGGNAFLTVKIKVLHPKLTVSIVSARGLRNADWIGKSDPICICEVPGNGATKIQTKTINDELNPVWNYEAVVPGYRVEDSLRFTVKDTDPLKADDLLGNLTLTSERMFPWGFSSEMRLSDAGDGCEAFLTINVVVGEKIEAPPAAPVTVAAVTTDPIPVEKGTEIIDDTSNIRSIPEDPALEAETAPVGLCWCGI